MLRTSEAVLVDDLNAFEEAGASVNVGLVDDDGRPLAARGFGLAVVEPEPLQVELLVPVVTLEAVGRTIASPPFAIAVTVSAIALFRSTQLKGTVRELRPPTDGQVNHARQQVTTLFEALHRITGEDLSILPSVMPESLLVATIAVAEAYDQTPGPGAGRTVGAGPS